jgi:O-antigen/teichoic acid export membrane protein
MHVATGFTTSAVVQSSGLLLLNTGVQALSGYLFWWLSAKMMDTASVGIASAVLAVCLLLSNIASLGLGPAMIYAHGSMIDRFAKVSTAAFLIASSAAMIAATVFTLGIPLLSPGMSEYYSPVGYIEIAVTTMGIGLAVLQDSWFLAQRRPAALVIRSLVALPARLIAMVLLAPALGHAGAVLAYGVGSWVAFSGGVCAVWHQRCIASPWLDLIERTDQNETMESSLQAGSAKASTPTVQRSIRDFRGLMTYSRDSYLVSVFGIASWSLLPVIVLNSLGPTAAAQFYMAMLFGNLVFALPQAMSTALFVENVAEPQALAQQSYHALSLALLCASGCGVALFILAPFVASRLGPSYAGGVPLTLGVLIASGIPMSFYTVGQSMFRARGKTLPVVIMAACVMVVAVIATSIGARLLGLVGVALGWLLSQSTGAYLWIYARKSFLAARAYLDPRPCQRR